MSENENQKGNVVPSFSNKNLCFCFQKIIIFLIWKVKLLLAQNQEHLGCILDESDQQTSFGNILTNQFIEDCSF